MLGVMDERFYTPKQVADILQVHQYTVLKWIREGKLRALKFGRVYRTTESELRAFLGQTAHDSAQQIMRSAADGPVVQESTVNQLPPRTPEHTEPLSVNHLEQSDQLDHDDRVAYQLRTNDQPIYSIRMEP